MKLDKHLITTTVVNNSISMMLKSPGIQAQLYNKIKLFSVKVIISQH